MLDRTITRRGFVRGALIGGAVLGLGQRPGFGWADEVTGQPEAGKIGDYQISLAEWSLHKRFFATGDAPKANLDFPRIAKEEFGIDAVEFVNQFFFEHARDEPYLKDLKQRADDQGVACLLIMIDREGDLSAANDDQRKQAVENHRKWIDAALALGCHSIRVNTGNNYSPTNLGAAVDGCSALAEYGKAQGINVICENHGGPSSDPDSLMALIEAVNMENFGTLPDFGNFPMERVDGQRRYTIDIYDAIARMMPRAKGVSAKCYDFDEDGNETVLDFPRIMKIVTDSGYNGHVGIEYEGNRLSEAEGIKAAKELLERLRGAEYQPS